MSPSIQHLDVPSAAGMADAILARPEGDVEYPGILLFMDAIGIRPVLEGMVGRLAAQGYVVLAPNLFYRSGHAPVVEVPDLRVPENRSAYFERLGPVMKSLTPELLVADAGSYLDFLAERSSTPFGTVGYCMGAAAALRTAAAYPNRIKAVATFHGGNLATDAENSPHLLLGQIQAELFVGHADQDHSMPPEQIARFDEALKASGLRYETELFAGAGHGWTMADTAAYHPEAAERHWDRMLTLFERLR